jgi:hypothetical protein
VKASNRSYSWLRWGHRGEFCLPSETTIKNPELDKIHERMAFQTLDIRQYKIVIPYRPETREMSPVVIPVYYLGKPVGPMQCEETRQSPVVMPNRGARAGHQGDEGLSPTGQTRREEIFKEFFKDQWMARARSHCLCTWTCLWSEGQCRMAHRVGRCLLPRSSGSHHWPCLSCEEELTPD